MNSRKRKRKNTRNDNFLRNMFIGFGSIFIVFVVGLIILNVTSDELKYKDFDNVASYEEIQDISDTKYLLYFYSESCSFCQQIKSRSLNFFEENIDDLPVYMLDADRIRGSKDSLNLPVGESLKSTPTLMVVDNGIITQFLVGTDEIKDFYDNYIE